MSTKIRKRMQASGGGEGGFTLIELLVVIIIIGILAAIAIPLYLSQRTRGYEATAQSDVKNMSMAEETYFAAHNAYGTLADIEGTDGGYVASPTVTPSVISTDPSGYCLSAVDTRGGNTYYINTKSGSTNTGPTTNPCL